MKNHLASRMYIMLTYTRIFIEICSPLSCCLEASSSELVLPVGAAGPLGLGGGEGSSPHRHDCCRPEEGSADWPTAPTPLGRLVVSNSVSDWIGEHGLESSSSGLQENQDNWCYRPANIFPVLHWQQNSTYEPSSPILWRDIQRSTHAFCNWINNSEGVQEGIHNQIWLHSRKW